MSTLNLEFSVLLVSYFTLTYNVFNFLHEKQPTPFIDEVFHIPQGLKYCHGNFSEWDPKITTLPGLYIISYGVLRIAEVFSSASMCSAYNLKLINVLSSSLILLLLHSILTFNSSGKNSKNQRMALWTALNISLFPVSFMFTFFYYTETLSTFFLLLMYRMHISKNFWIAAAIGCCSVLIRQTNIIWVGYLVLEMIMNNPEISKWARLVSKNVSNIRLVIDNIWRDLGSLGSTNNIFKIFNDAAGYSLTCFLFLVFIYLNRGIVVGDKTAHKPVIHLCQLFYFSLFTLVFAFPHSISHIRKFFNFINNNKIYSSISLIVGVFITHTNTLVHPYLLADNRHYSFYVWRRVYEQHIFRYILLPVYLFGLFFMSQSLKKTVKYEYWLCSILSLVPQKLLEFRYFILPFIIFRLQLRCKTWWHLLIESSFYVFINLLTLYIFVTKEFYWEDSKDIQRIIW